MIYDTTIRSSNQSIQLAIDYRQLIGMVRKDVVVHDRGSPNAERRVRVTEI